MNIPLGTDAVTAYRLAMDDEGIVSLGKMMSIWNAIETGKPHGIEDLPGNMRREDGLIISDQKYDPLRLSPEEIILEAFRITNLRHKPNKDGWHNLANIIRAGSRIDANNVFGPKGHETSFSNTLRNHVMFEIRNKHDVMQIRPQTGSPIIEMEPVKTTILLASSQKQTLADQPDFGSAYRALLALDTTLADAGIMVQFKRGEGDIQEIVVARFDGKSRKWVNVLGECLKRIHPSDPVRHSYLHGYLVNGHIGYVTTSKTGKIFANVGRPIDDRDDAFVQELERKEFDSAQAAIDALNERGDLDHVFTKTIKYGRSMGVWLSEMGDLDA